MRPCHHDTELHRVTAGGDCHQLRTVAANVLNKLSRMQNKCWFSRWEDGLQANNLKKSAYYEFKTKYIDFDSCFDKIQATENGHEVCNVECGMLD